MQREKFRLSVGLLVLTGLAFGCSQQLDESHGLQLIDVFRGDSNRELLMQLPDLQDFGDSVPTFSSGDGNETVARLLKAGVIVRRSASKAFPNIAGTFVGIDRTTALNWRVVLQLQQEDVSVNGTVQIGPSGFSRYDVTGGFSTDGTLRTTCTQNIPGGFMSTSLNCSFTVEQSDGTTRIRFVTDNRGRQQATVLDSEAPSIRTVDKSVYTFSFGEALAPFRRDKGFVVGTTEVASLRNLLLETETNAVGVASEKAILNDLGRAYFGKDSLECESNARFGKQPNGKWVVSNWTSCFSEWLRRD